MNILNYVGVIKPWGNYSSDYVAACLQSYLVCIEMLAFSIAHHYTFTYTEYEPKNHQLHRAVSIESLQEDYYDPYRIPVIRQLHAPMSFSQAFWSSTVPNETLNDIKRFSRGASSIIAERTNIITYDPSKAESL